MTTVNAMDFSIPKKTILDALARVVPCSQARSVVKALTGVRIRTEDDRVTLTCSDLVDEHQVSAHALIYGKGERIVPARALAKVLRETSDDDMRFTATPTGIEVASGRARMQLVAIDGELPARSGQPKVFVDLDARALAKVLGAVAPYMSIDSTRPHLHGTKVEWGPTYVRAIATDGHRLARVAEPARSSITGDCALLLPFDGAKRLRLFAEKAGVATLQVAATSALLTARAGQNQISLRIAEEEFPPYQKIVPTKRGAEITISRLPLLAACRRILAIVAKTERCTVFTFDGESLTLRAEKAQDGNSIEELPIAPRAEKRIFGANIRYLAEALTVLRSDYVRFVFAGNDPLEPIVLEPVGGDLDSLAVIMPARLS